MIDHLRFNKQDYYPASTLVRDYVNTKLIGRTVTYSKYKVAWRGKWNLDNSDFVDPEDLNWTVPVTIIEVGSTGKITGILSDKSNVLYYQIDFGEHHLGVVDNTDYKALIKASDIMSKYLAGEDL